MQIPWLLDRHFKTDKDNDTESIVETSLSHDEEQLTTDRAYK